MNSFSTMTYKTKYYHKLSPLIFSSNHLKHDWCFLLRVKRFYVRYACSSKMILMYIKIQRWRTTYCELECVRTCVFGCIFSCVFVPCKLLCVGDCVCKDGVDRSLTCKNMGLEYYTHCRERKYCIIEFFPNIWLGVWCTIIRYKLWTQESWITYLEIL